MRSPGAEIAATLSTLASGVEDGTETASEGDGKPSGREKAEDGNAGVEVAKPRSESDEEMTVDDSMLEFV